MSYITQTVKNIFNPKQGQWASMPDYGVSEFLGWGKPNPRVTGYAPVIGPETKIKRILPPQKPVTTPTGQTTTPPVDTGQTPQDSGQPNMGDVSNALQNQINDLYNQNLGIYSTAEQNLASARTLGEQQIGTTQQQSAREYQSAWEQAQNLFKGQFTGAEQAQTQATSENIRYLNNLQQQAASKYGQGSNVGGALSEIISQEFLRSQGNVRQAYTNSLNNIFGYQSQSQQTYELAVRKNDEDAKMQMDKLGQRYLEALANISAQKIQNEEGRTHAKLEVLQTLLGQSQAIRDNKQNIADQLMVWSATQGNQVSSALELAKNYATQATTQYGTDVSQILNIPNTSINSPTQAVTNTSFLNPKNDTTDQFGNLINPFQ